MGAKFVSKSEKTCALCGKKFVPSSNRQKYCPGPHYSECAICGKLFIFKVSDPHIKVCSEKCRIEQIKRTCEERYGESNYFRTQEFRDKVTAYNQQHYGVDHYTQSEEYKQKYNETMMKKYGVSSPLQNSEIKAKFLKTNNERYGGNSPTCSEEVKGKRNHTFDERYGGIGMGSLELKSRIQSTNFQKYGYENIGEVPEIRDKIRNTNMSRYGAPGYIFSDEYILPRLKHQDKIEEYLKFRDDPQSYIQSSFDHNPTITEISHKSGADIETVRLLIHRYELEYLISWRQSTIENEVMSFLQSLDLNTEIERNTHQIITPYELDFYLPQYKIGIECNPSSTHNSCVSFMNDKRISIIPPSYHKMKSNMCKEEGAFLLHLFGYEWLNRQEVMKSIIANLLGVTQYKYYARKLKIKDASAKESDSFLSVNHRQGTTSSKIRLGLYDGDELVSLMTFGKMRNVQGKRSFDGEDIWELSRFCSKLNTSVVGGASKLFKYFINKYDPSKVVSFSDVARSKGTLYETLGFRQVSVSDPSYVWTTVDDTIYYNRVSCQKSNLSNLLKDNSIDLSMTERQIMIEHGFVQVFDSGVVRWEWTQPTISEGGISS